MVLESGCQWWFIEGVFLSDSFISAWECRVISGRRHKQRPRLLSGGGAG